MTWIIETLNTIVDEEIEALPVDMQARLVRIAKLITTFGLENIREPHIKHIESSLWEMRMKGKDGISRALYVTARKKRIVIVRVFIKKTEKTSRREIEIALTRAREVQND